MQFPYLGIRTEATEMTFSYGEYLTTLLWFPLLGMGFALLAGSGLLKQFIAKLREERSVKNLIPTIGAGIILLAFIIPQCIYIFGGGLPLLLDGSQNALETCGTIEEIEEPSNQFQGFKNKNRHGADILIDGVLYFAITGGDLCPVDQVRIWYLPKSRVILKIEKV
jgi:uncharacterized SAM-binding protein YcdF (DUF218 family)